MISALPFLLFESGQFFDVVLLFNPLFDFVLISTFPVILSELRQRKDFLVVFCPILQQDILAFLCLLLFPIFEVSLLLIIVAECVELAGFPKCLTPGLVLLKVNTLVLELLQAVGQVFPHFGFLSSPIVKLLLHQLEPLLECNLIARVIGLFLLPKLFVLELVKPSSKVELLHRLPVIFFFICELYNKVSLLGAFWRILPVSVRKSVTLGVIRFSELSEGLHIFFFSLVVFPPEVFSH